MCKSFGFKTEEESSKVENDQLQKEGRNFNLKRNLLAQFFFNIKNIKKYLKILFNLLT